MKPALNQLVSGSIFDGKYEVLSRIGGGGMGEVYRVRHVHLDESRVIKVLRADLASSSEAAERFAREARIATQIKHPRVATLHDYSRLEDGSFYMVWESIEGQDVDHWLRQQGTLPLEIAVQLGIQGLSGLEAIHHAHIVHRDISPDNVMITTDSRGRLGVKIIDLGLAGDLREILASDGHEGLVGGKINYCSPEHIGLVPGVRPDHLSDVFGFAIVMYMMISGQLPFDTVSRPSDIAERFERGAHPLRGRTSVEVPEALSAVLQRALQVERTARYQSASEFRVALQDLVQGHRAPRPQPKVELDGLIEEATAALRERQIDRAATLIESLTQLAPANPEVDELRHQLGEIRLTQRRIQGLQVREMLDQYLKARQEPMARAALESLLELEPDLRDRDVLEERLARLSRADESGRRARQIAEELRGHLIARAEEQLSDSSLDEVSELAAERIDVVRQLDPELAERLQGEVEEFRRLQERDRLLSRQKQLVHSLIQGKRLDDAEREIERLAALGAPQVTVDLFRRDLAEVRRGMAREAKIALIEQELPRALERGAFREARELALELQQEDPSHPAVRRFLERIAEGEESAGRDAVAREGAATVAALIEAGRYPEARLALDILRRIDPQHSLISHFERRLAAASS